MAAWAVCTTCPTLVPKGTGKCDTCKAKARAVSDRQRRPNGNPYTSKGHASFRSAVLTRDPTCVLCHAAPATVADHWPTERRALVAQGLNPDDPTRGRGVCKPCHDRHTAQSSPAGWNWNPGSHTT